MRWLGLLSLIALLSCGQLTRDDLLSGNFGNVDRSAPTPLAPAPDAIATNLSAEFVWAPLFQAKIYTIEIATDENFIQPMIGSPFTTDKTSLAVSFPDDRDYFWRIRANTTAPGAYSVVRRLRVLGSVIRVHCPAAKSICGNPDAVGNKSAPFESLQAALNQASDLGLSEVQVAARGGSAHYAVDTLYLLSGIHVRGGYEASNWQRDIDANITEIRSGAQNLLFANGLTAATQVEGFTLRTTGPGTVLRCLNANLLEIRRNRFFTADVTDTDANGIWTQGCGNLLIRENQITMGNLISTIGTIRPVVRAIALHSTQAIVEQNTIRGGSRVGGAGGTGDATVLSFNGGNVQLNVNNIRTGQSEWNSALFVIGNAAVTIQNNTIICESRNTSGAAESCLSFDGSSGATNVIVRDNFIEIGSYAGSSGIRGFNSVSGAIFNNLILAGATGVDFNNAILSVRNNSIMLSDVYIPNKTGVFTSSAGARNFQNNVVAVWYGTGNRYCVHHNATGNGFATFQNNNLFGCATALFRQNTTDYLHICTDGKPGTTAGCTTGVDIASTSSTGNVNIDNTGSQLFVNIPKATDLTNDGPDANTTYDGTTNTIEVAACNTHGQYVVGEYIEYDRDGVARQITAVNCTASASVITFTPALSAASQRFKSIRLWGTNGTNFTIDARLKAPTTTATCNVVYGGLNLSSFFTTDYTGTTRTASLPTSGVCNGNVTNAGAAGWSLGAYERD